MKKHFLTIGIALIIGIGMFSSLFEEQVSFTSRPAVEPNWTAIAAWPDIEAAEVEAIPDPNRTFTAIVLDDSGSMGSDINAAKEAVVASLASMEPEDRLTVIALNAGEIIPFISVEQAAGVLPDRLARVMSDGGTPLTTAMQASRAALMQEAARSGGFGTYRILVTTDGVADDENALNLEIEDIARRTPIQVATIGVGISGNHILRRPDLAAFVAIDNVSQLAAALRDAIAEEQTFSATTTFEGSDGTQD